MRSSIQICLLTSTAQSTGHSLSATLVRYLSNIPIPPPLSPSLYLIVLCVYVSLYFCLRPSFSLCLCLPLCLSLSSPHSLCVSRCPLLVLARSLGSLHALALAFAGACALDNALGLARTFCVCIYFQHSLCLLSRACFSSLSCFFPLVLSRCLWSSLFGSVTRISEMVSVRAHDGRAQEQANRREIDSWLSRV